MPDLDRSRRPVPRHIVVQAVVVGLSGLLLVLTIAAPGWIEAVFGADPDTDNGTVELLIVACLGVIFVALVALTTIEWRRIRSRTPHIDGL